MKVKPTCPKCGERVAKDIKTAANWDVEKQDWGEPDEYDSNFFCDFCDWEEFDDDNIVWVAP
jgi:hypothetical protein